MIAIPDELRNRAAFFAQRDLPAEDRASRIEFLVEQMKDLPDDAFSEMTYLAGAAGCINLCGMCATGSAPNVTRITKEGIEDLVNAIGQVAREREIAVTSERPMRPGHVLLYFDDDPALNTLTEDLIRNVHEQLQVNVALSTHGWSRNNPELQEMHERIVSNLADAFREFRISCTRYPLGFKNRDEYQNDLANMLRTYAPLVDRIGTGSKGMRMEFHSRPLIQLDNVDIEYIDGHLAIHSGSYLVITANGNPDLGKAKITDFAGDDMRFPLLDKEGVSCFLYVSDMFAGRPNWREVAKQLIPHQNEVGGSSFEPHRGVLARKAFVYQFSNVDGMYFSLDPTLDERYPSFNAVHLYPQTKSRPKTGVLDTTRFILNAILQHKDELGLERFDQFPNATDENMERVVALVEEQRDMFADYNRTTAQFIDQEILPVLRCYVGALAEADYPPSFLFDWGFSSDTGVIGNAGRGITEFRGLISTPDSPVDLNDEKIRLLYEQRGKLWRWAPVPYMADASARPKGFKGWKNELADSQGIVEVSPVARRDYEPIYSQAHYIAGVPMEQTLFTDTKGQHVGPGSLQGL